MDRGRSGYKNVSRKGFDAAITAATAGVVGVLIVWKLDRLPRKGIGEVGKALDDIGRVGGRLVSVWTASARRTTAPGSPSRCWRDWRATSPATLECASATPSGTYASGASGSADSRLTGCWWTRRRRSSFTTPRPPSTPA
ncbi:recombinase family protein [Streptomyces pratensis]|uniref:recombinase family protein n=1 Tax=Streptomyces pratensis TaxID=1169025 RepID=UPI003AFB6FA7